MLRMIYYCSKCDHTGSVSAEDMKLLIGYCPNCHSHHGEVEYYADMPQDEFINTLAQMSEKEIATYAHAIKVMADCYSEI